MLIIWDEWRPDLGGDVLVRATMVVVGDGFQCGGWCDGVGLTPKGAALVAQYREHMAAERDAKAARAINGVP
jgi:hypothetical protein